MQGEWVERFCEHLLHAIKRCAGVPHGEQLSDTSGPQHSTKRIDVTGHHTATSCQGLDEDEAEALTEEVGGHEHIDVPKHVIASPIINDAVELHWAGIHLSGANRHKMGVEPGGPGELSHGAKNGESFASFIESAEEGNSRPHSHSPAGSRVRSIGKQ